MNRGRKTGLLAGVAATGVLLICLGLSDEIRIQYSLYRLRSGAAESLADMMDRPEGTAERKAVNRFVATARGRRHLLFLTVSALAAAWERPLGGGGDIPPFRGLGQALCGMRFRPSKNEWSLWTDIRAPSGMHRGTMAIVLPSFASGASLADALKVMCREAEPQEEIVLSEYPRLRLRVFPFEEGLNRYEASLKALGRSIEASAFWFETLESWPEMLRSESLLPWVIHVDCLDD